MNQRELAKLWKLDVQTIYAVAGWYVEENRSIIYTSAGMHYSEKKPQEVLNALCMLHGSSYRGREEATRQLSNEQFKKKVPVLISSSIVAAFPTSSPHQTDCVWLFNHPMVFEKMTHTRTRILFPTGESVEVNASIPLLEKQRGRMFCVVGYTSLHK